MLMERQAIQSGREEEMSYYLPGEKRRTRYTICFDGGKRVCAHGAAVMQGDDSDGDGGRRVIASGRLGRKWGEKGMAWRKGGADRRQD